MLNLQLPTDPRWVQLVESDLHQVMVDHAWCEHKAASNAMSIIVRFPEHTTMVQELTRIAREEMEHFAMVVERIEARGWQLSPERKDNYVNDLLTFVRKDGAREERLVDRLLFSAMIEARSCERFKLLSERLEDEDLRSFYRDLMVSEAGHYTTFIGFARRFGSAEAVNTRWQLFLHFEAELIAQYGRTPTMHG